MGNLFTNTTNKSPIGFTTNMFVNALKNKEITLKELLFWAKEKGFSWVEIRDSNIDMTRDELLELKQVADNLKLGIHYAWNSTDLLNPNDEEFEKAIENALTFGKNVHCRIVISPEQFKKDESKLGYSREELEKIISKMQEYIKISEDREVVLCFENTSEPLKGDSEAYFGIVDMLEKLKSIKTTFDPGNFMNKGQTRVRPSSEEVIRYAEDYNNNIPYVHIKTTKENVVQASINENSELDLKELFNRLTAVESKLICLEIPGQKDYKLMEEKVIESLNYLARESIIISELA